MATETAVPDQVTNEHLEPKENEESKATEQENVSSLKTEELEIPKALVTEPEEKTEDLDKHQPAVVEVEKVNGVPALDVPGLDVPAEEIAAVKEDTDPKSDVSSVSEPAVEDVKIETEGQAEISGVPEAAVESVEKSFDSSLALEPGAEVETKPEVVQEEPKIVEKPGSDTVELEVDNKPEVFQSEIQNVDSELTAEAPQTEKQVDVLEAETRTAELPAPVVEVEEKQHELSENIEEVEKKIDEPKADFEGEVVKEKEVSVNEPKEVLVTESSIEEGSSTVQEPVANESSVELASRGLKVPTEEGVSLFLDASDKTLGDNAQKEESGVNVVESATEISPEVIKAEEEKLEKDVKDESTGPVTTTTVYLDASDKTLGDNTQKVPEVEVVAPVKEEPLEVIKNEEESLQKNVKDEELTEAVTTPVEEIVDSNSAAEITERPVDEDKASADVEPIARDERVEIAEVDFAPPVETVKDSEPLITKTEEGADSSSTKDIGEESIEVQKASKDVEVVTEEKKPEEANDFVAPVEIPKDEETQSSKLEGGDDSKSVVVLGEKSVEEEKPTKEVDVVTEEKKEGSIEDGTTTAVEPPKDADLEGKVDLNTVDAADEMVVESKELDLESKVKDIAETNVDKLEKPAEVAEETTKSDSQNLETTNSTDDSKTIEDSSKEVPTKPAHKHSNKIMSKVKQQFVKVRKAITGKSASPKPITADSKEDITVK